MYVPKDFTICFNIYDQINYGTGNCLWVASRSRHFGGSNMQGAKQSQKQSHQLSNHSPPEQSRNAIKIE